MTFSLDYKVTGIDSMNKIYAGNHWTNRNNYSTVIHALVKSALNKQQVPKKPFVAPVCISIYYPEDSLDLDNHGYLSKCIIDGLKGWVIQDDNKKYVRSYTQEFYQGDRIVVVVEELEAER